VRRRLGQIFVDFDANEGFLELPALGLFLGEEKLKR
jgi:hypothetical protein